MKNASTTFRTLFQFWACLQSLAAAGCTGSTGALVPRGQDAGADATTESERSTQDAGGVDGSTSTGEPKLGEAGAPGPDSDAAEDSHSTAGAGGETKRDGSAATGTASVSDDAGSCEVPLTVQLSPHIPTVLLLETSELGGWSDVEFEYWRDTEDGEEVNVELNPGTPILGLVPDTTYRYRVAATNDGVRCSSISEFRTGSAPSNLPRPTVSDPVGASSAGYLLTTPESTDPDASGYAAIYDSSGQPVWWYRTSLPGLLSRAHLSWDGREVWVRDTNPLGRDTGRVVRIPLDGTTEEYVEIPLGHHDFVPVPDGFLFLVGGGQDTCDDILHLSTGGDLTTLYSLREAFGDSFRPGALNACHCNSIDYNVDDESISVSCLNQNAFVKLSASGELKWVLGGNNGQSHFAGDVAWDRQHGHHFISPSRMVFFNNMGGGDSEFQGALAVELELNLETMTARRVWEYAGGAASPILGDAEYLPNGNVLVTYSNAGELHEVNKARELVRLWKFPDGVGYAQHHEHLLR